MADYFTKDGDDYVKVTEPLHTQEHLDQVVKERADRIARNNYPDYDDLKEKASKVDTITKDFEGKLKEKDTANGELQKQLGKAQLETTKVKVTHEFKLSDELAEFVTGDTEDEMRERAEKLSKNVKPGAIKIDKDKKPDDKGTDSKVIAGKLFGNKSDD